MKFNVDDIHPEGISWKSSKDMNSSFADEEGLSFTSPVDIDVRLAKEGGKVFLSGQVKTELKLTCTRCLEPSDHHFLTKLELVYYPKHSDVAEGERELQEDDLVMSYYCEGIIDISEDVRESIILNLPVKPLCKVGCRGLCPQCGGNLNEKECACREEENINLRLAKLKELIED